MDLLLRPFGWIYGRVIDGRNRLYDRGVFRSYSLGARTISVGNITTGGTGKTPLVALAAEMLANSGATVCILTRGYGRSTSGRVLVSDGETVLANAETGGDEPVELAYKLLGKAIVIVDADRVAAAKFAKSRFGVTAFVLDDGFQHRRVKRDVDVVCIDATDPFGKGLILPAGRLREPIRALNRADAVVITRADLVEDISPLRSKMSDFASQTFTAENRIARFSRVEDFQTRSQNAGTRSYLPANTRVAAFCAVGNPDAFFQSLKRVEDLDLAMTRKFRDHRRYSQADVFEIERIARQHSVDLLVTTAKDSVKLTSLQFEIPCYVAEIETVVEPADEFCRLILGR